MAEKQSEAVSNRRRRVKRRGQREKADRGEVTVENGKNVRRWMSGEEPEQTTRSQFLSLILTLPYNKYFRSWKPQKDKSLVYDLQMFSGGTSSARGICSSTAIQQPALWFRY